MGCRFQVQVHVQMAGLAHRGRRAFAIPRFRPAGLARRGAGLQHSTVSPDSGFAEIQGIREN